MEAFLKEFQHLKIHLEEIKSATSNFDDINVIGKGGFGKVYKGVLSHSSGRNIVAFKRLDRRYGQGDPEFLKEILMLSRYTHQNLISLLGFCDEEGEKILVYEHASNGSLDLHLGTTTLTWRQRLKICLMAAKGLCYLHGPNGTQRVIHRDIKSSNILLDNSWNAKVSDMGLAKIGPANQPHSFLATNVVGTFGYIDPLYMETYSLTKESDVYSFGVVLLEVLCGRLCFENKNDHFQILVPTWKKSYEEKKLDRIIFEDIKQQIDSRSLETFSSIVYQCLQKSREERPNMAHVVEKLEIALRFQDISGEVEPPIDYEELSKTAVPPLVYRSEEELKMLLSKGICVNRGRTWFSLNKYGEHCEMISAAECLIVYSYPKKITNFKRKKSRFPLNFYNSPLCWEFKIRVTTQLLSPHITYAVNLVFDFDSEIVGCLSFNYTLAGEKKAATLYFADDRREDGWFVAELYQFTSDGRNVDLDIMFDCQVALLVEGIEFQPVERVEHGVLEVDMKTKSDSDAYWEHKLPRDYKDILMWSKNNIEWTTKKELYYILSTGFQTYSRVEWYSLGKNRKNCIMRPARVCLEQSRTIYYFFVQKYWSWGSMPESRFEEVAFDPSAGSFLIECRSTYLLSPETSYGIYLIFKIEYNYSYFELPVRVTDQCNTDWEWDSDSWYIYLVSPQTPVIGRKDYQNTHNPLNRPKMKCLPQQRTDGWMEVRLWNFETGNTTESISRKFKVTSMDNKPLKGLIVEGIEFKPI